MISLLLAIFAIIVYADNPHRPSIGTRIEAYAVPHFGNGTWSATRLVTGGSSVPLVNNLDAFHLIDTDNKRMFTDLVINQQWTTDEYGAYTLTGGICYKSPNWTFSFKTNISFAHIYKESNLPGHYDLYSGLYIDYPAGNMAYDTVINYRTGYIYSFSWTQPWRLNTQSDGSCSVSYDQFYGSIVLSETHSLTELPNPVDSYFVLPSICNASSPEWTDVYCWNVNFH